MRFLCLFLVAAFVFLPCVQPVFADDKTQPTMPNISLPVMTDNMKGAPDTSAEAYLMEARDDFASGHYKKTLELIDKAQTAVRAKRAELYRPLLPEPSSGWQADDNADKSITAGSALVGGMSIVSRTYVGYGHSAKITFVLDSPMMGLMSGLLKTVGTMGSQKNSAETVRGNQAMYQENTNHSKGPAHSLTVFAGDMLVTVSSDTLNKNVLMQFANVVDYDKLKAVQ